MTHNENNLFQSAMKDVRRLDAPKPKQKKTPAPSCAPPIIPTAPLSEEELAQEVSSENFAELFEGNTPPEATPVARSAATRQAKATDAEQESLDCHATLAEQNPTKPRALPPLTIGDLTQLDKQTADRLKRGKLPIDFTLDLHGLNKNAAHDQFASIIENAAHSGARLVLIITGKGQRSEGGRAILREALKDWLNLPALRPLLIACCPAHIKDGGDGAFYCLLKRKRNR